MIEIISLDKLSPHPDNPRLFLRDEIIESIANQIIDTGRFDEAHALIVRPFNGHYQIIQGHHRRAGALKAGLEAVPCWVREMSDDEAYMALALGNVQGELSPLEIGIHALNIDFDKRGVGAKGGGLKEYAELLGFKTSSKITEYRQGADVLKSINSPGGINGEMIKKAKHLAHIHKAPQETWQQLAQWLLTPNDKDKLPSANQTEKLVKAIRKYDIPDEYKDYYPLESIVKSYLEKSHPTPDTVNSLVNTVRGIEAIIETNAAKFPHHLFPFTLADFRQWLRDGLGTYTWEISQLNQYRDDVVMAAQEAYKPQPADCHQGEWYKLGEHLLYCGDTSQPEFYSGLPEVPFIFADPPYNAKVGKWDDGFEWGHDWIGDKGIVAAVTPGIANVQSFFKNDTDMTCNWSMACWIDNGQTRGALGFGNWIYIALFYEGSIHKSAQDHLRASISTADTKDSKHRGRKPPGLIKQLIELFSEVGEIVIDPFLGSGTTLFEADTLGRRCIGGEIEPEFCNEIINRWQVLTGQSATRRQDGTNTDKTETT